MPAEETNRSEKPNYSFKNVDFQHLNISNGKKKPWKTLKQVLSQEQSLVWPESDPQTKLHYASTEEFQEIRRLPSDIVQGYLTLRKANALLQ